MILHASSVVGKKLFCSYFYLICWYLIFHNAENDNLCPLHHPNCSLPKRWKSYYYSFVLHNAKLATSSRWLYKRCFYSSVNKEGLYFRPSIPLIIFFGPFTFIVVIISSRKDMKHLSKLYSLTTSFLLSYVRKETYIALVEKTSFLYC